MSELAVKPLGLMVREIRHRWRTSLLTALVVAGVTAAVTFFAMDAAYYLKEVSRDVRDLGSNVMILPAELDPLIFYQQGGYSDRTMPESLVARLVDERLSLNHLIPILERWESIELDSQRAAARVVGISASIPLPGRPRLSMQSSVPTGQVQLGSRVADQLELPRDFRDELQIAGRSFQVQRINRETGTWQDAAVFMDLREAQDLLGLPGVVSRIEALECLDEACVGELGHEAEELLRQELATVTDQAILLRQRSVAEVRQKVRQTAELNTQTLQAVLWSLLVVALVGLTAVNSLGRLREVGVLLSVGYGRAGILGLFLGRVVVLAGAGGLVGGFLGAAGAWGWCRWSFSSAAPQFHWDSGTPLMVAGIAVLLAVLGGCLPAVWIASRPPATILNREW